MNSRCIQCNTELTDDEEKQRRERYDALIAQGIVPIMVSICNKCKEPYYRAISD